MAERNFGNQGERVFDSHPFLRVHVDLGATLLTDPRTARYEGLTVAAELPKGDVRVAIDERSLDFVRRLTGVIRGFRLDANGAARGLAFPELVSATPGTLLAGQPVGASVNDRKGSYFLRLHHHIERPLTTSYLLRALQGAAKLEVGLSAFRLNRAKTTDIETARCRRADQGGTGFWLPGLTPSSPAA